VAETTPVPLIQTSQSWEGWEVYPAPVYGSVNICQNAINSTNINNLARTQLTAPDQPSLHRHDVITDDIETAWQGYFRIDRHHLRHRRFDGSTSDLLIREVLERGHVAAVLPIDLRTRQLVLIEQIRPGALAAGLEPWLLECVAGIIEPGETAEDVARREAVEEAGCEISQLVPIAEFLPSPGAVSETVRLYCGRTRLDDVGGLHGLAEEGEDIKVHVMTIEKALELLAHGRIVNAKTIIALQWLALNQSELDKLLS